MNTVKTLQEKFGEVRLDDREYSILRNKIEEVDIDFVILNLLRYDYVLDINGSKYDITFGLNKKTGEIGNFMNPYPNSNILMGSEVVEKGFKEGKWYYVTNEELDDEEFEKSKKEIEKLKEMKELKDRELFIDNLIDIVKSEEDKSAIKRLKSKLMDMESKTFYDFMNNIMNVQEK